MYTCKNCLEFRNMECCPYPDHAEKDKVSKDEDSWAFYCESFRGCEPHSIIYKGFEITQVSNFNIYVVDPKTHQCYFHAQCTKYLTDKELKRHAELSIKIREESFGTSEE